MYKIEFVILLSVMTFALGLTGLLGFYLKKEYVMKFKYSILSVLIYNMVLLSQGFFSREMIVIAFENLVPVVGLFIWRNIFVEFHRSINRDEKNAPISIFVRVVPYIYLFMMALSLLQHLTGGGYEDEIIGAFHYSVVIGVLVYQLVLVLEMFIINQKLRLSCDQKYQHVFRTNLLALVVYVIVVFSNVILGTLIENMIMSGVMYTIMVGFFFVNYVPDDFLYEAKLFQNNVTKLVDSEEKPNLTFAYDALTGMYTREYFIRHIKTFDEDDETMSVVVMVISGLKQINNSFGYEYGDEILQEVTLIIDEVFKNSTIARMDGSQFAVMQVGLIESELKDRINTVMDICRERDGFLVDIHFGYALRGDSRSLLYEIYKKAEEDLYAKRLKYNLSSQDAITNVLYSNFCMQMPAVAEHGLRCAKMAEAYARFMDYPEKMVRNIYNAALLHDIALTAMPNMEAYELSFDTDLEKRMYENHTAKGYEIAVELGVHVDTAKGILYHHEAYDGSGFPYGLKHEEIPEIAQIVAIVDEIDLLSLYHSDQSLDKWLKSKIRVAFPEKLVYNMIDFLNAGQ
ncbi:diguanylate cyclase [Acidaminobacter sp. JC074]|uniref:HD-GYP domain-containing protein n=1 Tax=Acidaminobacter sp. JC074 TaxID=2530199 RepID=UPI001F0F0C9C|nr:HD domain-containing phosphohydrolase [Acidaminobacter sp. JC074]MCH4888702.1 diguanylate cyclase [Acidaminobacter sp. JC074]